jgi:hypothetical protein
MLLRQPLCGTSYFIFLVGTLVSKLSLCTILNHSKRQIGLIIKKSKPFRTLKAEARDRE